MLQTLEIKVSLSNTNLTLMSEPAAPQTITNDDAVVDCIVYSCEEHTEERVPLTRRVVDFDSSGKDCSVTLCGNDEEPGVQLLRYCENGHCLHTVCIEYLFDKSESLSTAVCPQCRSERMIRLVLNAKPIESDDYTRWVGSYSVANDIMRIASLEAQGLDVEPAPTEMQLL